MRDLRQVMLSPLYQNYQYLPMFTGLVARKYIYVVKNYTLLVEALFSVD